MTNVTMKIDQREKLDDKCYNDDRSAREIREKLNQIHGILLLDVLYGIYLYRHEGDMLMLSRTTAPFVISVTSSPHFISVIQGRD